MNRVMLALLIGVSVSACGTTLHGSSARLFSGRWRDVAGITSSTSAAEVWVDGSRYGAIPAVIDLDEQQGRAVSFKRSGYQDMSVQLARAVPGKYVILDVIDGRLPVVVDADTQSWYVLDPHALHVTLQPASDRAEGVTARGTLTDEQVNRLVAGASAASLIDSKLRR